MGEKATIYDYARLCRHFDCINCPLYDNSNELSEYCRDRIMQDTDEANEIILNWCKEHPVKTRQDKFLKMFPNATIDDKNILSVYPCDIDRRLSELIDGKSECDNYTDCYDCKKSYWLAEVE